MVDVLPHHRRTAWRFHRRRGIEVGAPVDRCRVASARDGTHIQTEVRATALLAHTDSTKKKFPAWLLTQQCRHIRTACSHMPRSNISNQRTACRSRGNDRFQLHFRRLLAVFRRTGPPLSACNLSQGELKGKIRNRLMRSATNLTSCSIESRLPLGVRSSNLHRVVHCDAHVGDWQLTVIHHTVCEAWVLHDEAPQLFSHMKCRGSTSSA